MKLISAFVLLLFVFGVFRDSPANEISVVVPNGLEEQEGNQSTNRDADFTNGLRIQVIYPASQFDTLPEGGAWLTEIRFRPDRFVTAPRMHSFDRWFFRVSTTDKTLETLSVDFADNIGADEAVAYDGPITMSTDAGGPPTGPRPFDYVIPVDPPFFYDPAKGDLLTDNTQTPGEWIRPDSHVGVLGERSVVSFDPNAPSGEKFFTSVAEFVFVPEPSGAVLALLAGIALVSVARSQLS